MSALLVLALTLGVPIFAGVSETLEEGQAALGQTWNSKQIWLSGFVALVATGLSLLAALGLAAMYQSRVRLLTWLSLPLLAAPHAAVAQALSLLLAPSGFLVRLLSPWATGYSRPPQDWLWDQHPDGWTLILALAIKEIPFFLILIYTYSANLPTRQWLDAGTGLGYARTAAWWHLVLPVILPRLLLPLFVVLAFSLSVVDVAAIVGPSRLKTFAHTLHQAWQSDTPTENVLAGASWLLVLTLLFMALIFVLISCAQKWLKQAMRWSRHIPALGLPQFGAVVGSGILFLGYVSLAILPLQSIIETTGRRTHFPDLWTGKFGLNAWGQAFEKALPTLPTTLLIGGLATLFSLILVLWILEGEARSKKTSTILDTLLLIPLFLPQFAFLSGGAFLGLKWDLIPDQSLAVAVWFHFLFVFPYIFLVLAPAHRGFDSSLVRIGLSLGKSPNSLFWRLKLPVLLRPISYAVAWGLAVSLALYLPTFFASGGRFDTLLTVGVTQLAGKGDSVRAVWGLLLLILPFSFFGLASALSALQSHNRRSLKP